MSTPIRPPMPGANHPDRPALPRTGNAAGGLKTKRSGAAADPGLASPFRALLAAHERPVPEHSTLRSACREALPREPMPRERRAEPPRASEAEPTKEHCTRTPEPVLLELFVAGSVAMTMPVPVSSERAALPGLDQAALAVAAELVESLRVGRFGRDGHTVSLRLRRAEGTLGVELFDDGDGLALRLTSESNDAGMAALGARVREELAARGIELDGIELG